MAAGRKTPAANCADCRATPHTPAECPCLPAGRWCHGFHAATLDQRRINQWWGSHPGFGVGIACGPTGLVVVDIDAHPAQPPGRDRILPVWYRAADNRRWQCSSGSSQGRALARQVDVRAHGGHIIAPGTTTVHGTYTAIDDVREPAVLAAGGGRARTQRMLTSVLAPVEACGQVTEGAGFSDTLNRAAHTVGGLVAAGRLTQEDAEQVLRQAATAARPGQERRIEQIIRSGLAAGLKRPLYTRRGRP
ncbi:bifunctional DNA primase/polymerase [Streptomyces sp. NPDC050625]|uniref:bifunctional DNA primase/polymerase n=1 Tax=Streptomyces sp. NPDC050625 TaxID=3154629 RepID=UPI00341A1F77